jgi:hypothetical protein
LLSQNKFFRMIPIPFPKTNQDRILRAEKLMSFDPSMSPVFAAIQSALTPLRL